MLNTIKELIYNKKVLILGFGREGKSSFELIKKAGGYSSLAISDMNRVDPGDDTYVIYGVDSYQKCLNDYDIVFKSPGIVLEHEPSTYLCKIVSQTECFFKRYRNQIIGITGTKGKSTTTKLIYTILKQAGKDVLIAGNIGIPAFDIWEQVNPDTIIVFEMSSHQLEYMTVSPAYGIYLNIHEEHLDHYGTMEKYVRAKENIYLNQKPGDILFVNELIAPASGCNGKVVTIGYDNKADVVISGNTFAIKELVYTIPVEHIKLIGEHNYFNIAVAFAVCREFNVSIGDFTEGLCEFEPLPHRLSLIGMVDGVKYYDDSISTICDTTIQALKSIKDVDTVIIGGMDRGIDYKDLICFLSEHKVTNIILMAVTGKRIYEEIMTSYEFTNKERLHLVDTLEDAVELAKQITAKGKSCVMSPAAASYGIFKNFEERGEVFTRLVRS